MDKKVLVSAVAVALIAVGGGSIYVAEKSIGESVDQKFRTAVDNFNQKNGMAKITIDSADNGLFAQKYNTTLNAGQAKIGKIDIAFSHGLGAVFSGKSEISGQVDLEDMFAKNIGLEGSKLAMLSGEVSKESLALSADISAIKFGPGGQILDAKPFTIGGNFSGDEQNASLKLFLKNFDVKTNPAAIVGNAMVSNSTINVADLSISGKLVNGNPDIDKIDLNLNEINVTGIGSIKGGKVSLDLKFNEGRIDKKLALDVDKLDFFVAVPEGLPSKDIKISVRSNANIPFIKGGVTNLMNITDLLVPTDSSREFWTKGVKYNLEKFEVSYPGSKLEANANIDVTAKNGEDSFSFVKNASFNIKLNATGAIAKNYGDNLEQITNGEIKSSDPFKIDISYKNGVVKTDPNSQTLISDVPKALDNLDINFGYTQPKEPVAEVIVEEVVEQAPATPEPSAQQVETSSQNNLPQPPTPSENQINSPSAVK